MYKCKKCSSAFNRRDVMLRHLQTHSGKLYSCKICGNIFKYKSDLARHEKNKHIKKINFDSNQMSPNHEDSMKHPSLIGSTLKFIEQNEKLPVYNIDTPNTVTQRHGTLLPNTVRALVLGSSGCGKTNLIYFLLVNEHGLRFENVYIYSKTLQQPKYQLLKKIINEIDGVNISMFYENDQVISPEKVLPNSVFIMDDVIGEHQGIIREYFSRGRHNKVDIFYLAQSYSKVPKQLIRDNANLIVLFKQDETNLKHVYNEHCSGDMTYPEFKHFCTTCWNRERFSFIVISKDSERDNGRYRLGFDTFVII